MNKKIIQICVGELLKNFINTRNSQELEQGSFNFEDYIETLIDLYDKSNLYFKFKQVAKNWKIINKKRSRMTIKRNRNVMNIFWLK